MSHIPATKRRGFTLLELILAISLSAVLFLALYWALNIHYYHARAGREVIDETSLIRSVVTRISQDIYCQLPPVDPRLQGDSQSGGTGSAPPGGGATTTGGGTAAASSTDTSNTVVFNTMVYGDEGRVVLTGRWVPKDLTQPPLSPPSQTCDLRRVTYWMTSKGLARQEVRQVMGADAQVLPPDSVTDEALYVIGPEVTNFSIEYFDGTNWQTTWDGTTLDTTTSRPIGPPAAIAFTITFRAPRQGMPEGREITYRHVVAIPTANNLTLAPSTATTPTTTTAP
jgi:prepilin-type N-terminal cleavage/methylation domain-containing protein